MTAFTSYSTKTDWGLISWEIRSVNHRYLDITIKLPEGFRALESEYRALMRPFFQRGKIEAQCVFLPDPQKIGGRCVNQTVVSQLIKCCQEISKLGADHHLPQATDLLRHPGVLQEDTQHMDAVAQESLAVLKAACEQVRARRQKEGAELGEFIRSRLTLLAEGIEHVSGLHADLMSHIRTRLDEKLADIADKIDEHRLAQEIVLYAQKMDFSEEIDRIGVHIGAVKEALAREEPIGRRLDFLMQELNREVNTLGSKANASEVSLNVVDFKVYIEQMREQIQNVE